jgi:hypothetical protein
MPLYFSGEAVETLNGPIMRAKDSNGKTVIVRASSSGDSRLRGLKVQERGRALSSDKPDEAEKIVDRVFAEIGRTQAELATQKDGSEAEPRIGIPP